jgi:glutamyl-tRNA reductase
MSIFAIGVNHKTAAIDLREKVYFALDKLSLYVQDLTTNGIAEEAVLLSTCNRSELYCNAKSIEAVCDWFSRQTTLPREVLAQALYIYRDRDAVAHMMAVACGLDSMILGEPQILGQMKEAFSESCTAGVVGTSFQRLFQQIFAVAKEIRTSTAIGACPVSVASAAVHFAKQQFINFSRAKVALIGAGDTSELIVRYLGAHQITPFALINRSTEKEAPFGCKMFSLDHLNDVLLDADLVFSATSSPRPIVTKAIMQQGMAKRPARPIVLIDVAVPRDIDQAVIELPNVTLYCIDDLKTIIEKNRQGREHASIKALEMIRQKSSEFMLQANSIDKVSHTIRAYRGQVEDICHSELIKAKHQLLQGADPTKVLDEFAYAFMKKLLHAPSVNLRQAGFEGRLELLRFANQLFALPDPEVECL